MIGWYTLPTFSRDGPWENFQENPLVDRPLGKVNSHLNLLLSEKLKRCLGTFKIEKWTYLPRYTTFQAYVEGAFARVSTSDAYIETQTHIQLVCSGSGWTFHYICNLRNQKREALEQF